MLRHGKRDDHTAAAFRRRTRVLPPKLSCSSRVSLESRKGMWVRSDSPSARTQLPRQDRDWLIAVSSCIRLSDKPPIWWGLIFSEPAKSTRFTYVNKSHTLTISSAQERSAERMNKGGRQ